MEPITVRKETGENNKASNNEKKSGGKKTAPKWLPKALQIAVLVLAVGAAAYFYQQYRQVRDNPSQAVAERNTEETNKVLDELNKILLIEETETPTVARVDDPDKLKQTNEEFYKNVEKNDYLVLYPKRAILFRQSNNQIINIAPIINTSELRPAEDSGGQEQ